MTRRDIPVVIRKDGDRFVPIFPVDLEEGDELIIARETASSRVPAGKKWTVSGWTTRGPIRSVVDKDEFLKTTNPLARMNIGECTAEAPCCGRRGEYNGYHSGPLLLECPKHCSCHD